MPEVQVRIGKNLPNIMIEGRHLERQMLGQSEVQNFAGKKILHFNCENLRPGNGPSGKKAPLFVSRVSSTTGILKWNHIPYRGELVVATTEDQKKCDLINRIPMENYISSLLAKEMNSSWPLEALKAQAVAARTYAYQKMQINKNSGGVVDDEDPSYDLESSEKHQVGGGFFDETQITNEASLDTKGEILVTAKGRLTPIFYHAKCGGRTYRPDSIWESQVEGYTAVECPYCHKYGQKDWVLSLSKKEFLEVLSQVQKANVRKNTSVFVAQDLYDRVLLRVYLGENPVLVKKPALRQALGRKKLPSNQFKASWENGRIKFVGRGYGHGVGMCQLGALEMAKQGYDYKSILAHYFPRHKIKKIY